MLFQEFSEAFSFEYGFQEPVEDEDLCDDRCGSKGKDLCEDCDICFEKVKGRAIWSDTMKCGDCDEREKYSS